MEAKRKRQRTDGDADSLTGARDVDGEVEVGDGTVTTTADGETDHDGLLLEGDVGITEYLAPHSSYALKGIIKERYSDFVVNEIALDGKVERLTEVDLPSSLGGSSREPNAARDAEASTSASTPATTAHAAKLGLPFTWTEETLASLREQTSDRVVDELQALTNDSSGEQGTQSRTNSNKTVTTDPMPDKAVRTRFHEMIRTISKGSLQTTSTKEGEIIISLISRYHRNTPRQSNGTKSIASSQGKRYIHFLMFKKNRDTTDALAYMARTFRPVGRAPIRVADFHVRGSKDKRAVTTQKVGICAKDFGRAGVVSFWKMMGGTEGRAGIRLGNWEWAEHNIRLGELNGNRFSIVIRDLQLEGSKDDPDATLSDAVKTALESLERRGFINYFGMQRFGTSSMGTHKVGAALLRSDWALAISRIMKPRSSDPPDVDRARRIYADGPPLESLNRDDFIERVSQALDAFPYHCTAERAMLTFWKRGGTSTPLASLAVIPRHLRTMYTHAYQSYVWNKVTSARLRIDRDSIIEGDLVIIESATTGNAEEEEADETLGSSRGRSALSKVHVVTEEDAAKKTFAITDVVLPLPGSKISYPQGAIGELYKQIMLEDGLSHELIERIHPDYQLSGFYRNIIELPSDVRYKLIPYQDSQAQLNITDEDRLLGETAVVDPADTSLGQSMALRIEFSLRSSTYATMALREILRQDTSSAQQALLTKERVALAESAAELASSSAQLEVEPVSAAIPWSIKWDDESQTMFQLAEMARSHSLDRSNNRIDDVAMDSAKRAPSPLSLTVDDIDVNVLGENIRRALKIVDGALTKFGPAAIALAVNGGKESGVVLHLYSLAYHRYCRQHGLPFDKMKAIYVCSPDPFPQIEDFVEESRLAYHLDLVRINGGMRDALTAYKKMHPQIDCVLVGTRRHDPHGDQLDAFKRTDVAKGWPDYIRCHPIIDWTYRDVWDFTRKLEVRHCILYDLGYSSLGSIKDTEPNPQLRNEAIASGWNPAWMLADESLERAGRQDKR